MLSRFKSPRTHLLLLAFSLLSVSLILGLSAYLTDTKTYNPSFRTATGQELEFEVTGKDYDKALLVPGGTISLDAKATVNGETPLYVFIGINTPAALSRIIHRRYSGFRIKLQRKFALVLKRSCSSILLSEGIFSGAFFIGSSQPHLSRTTFNHSFYGSYLIAVSIAS